MLGESLQTCIAAGKKDLFDLEGTTRNMVGHYNIHIPN